MSRPGSASGEDRQYRATPIVGGLEASMPPHMLDPSMSPELNNVVLNNNGVEKRGGFIPVIKSQPTISSIKNRGHHGRMRINNTTTSADADVVIVPGCAYAGHRLVYETLNLGLALDFFTICNDLTQFHVGNQRTAGEVGAVYTTPNESAGYRIRVRPILSKGPAKRFYAGDGTVGPTDPLGTHPISWHTTASQRWGPAAGEAHMPWCVYLHQDTSGVWEFRVAWHSIHIASGQFDLLTIRMPVGTLKPATGVLYHIIFSHAPGVSATFRIGVVSDKTSLPTYYTATTIVNQTGATISYADYRAPALATTGPVQMFDCPQEFIAAPATRSATRPPGLDLGGATVGDYWFATKRYEGFVEDLVIWSTNRLASGTDTLDRMSKIDLLAHADTDIVSYWPMTEPGRNYVKEVTGRGNHLYFLPGGPTYDPSLGSPESGLPALAAASWWFNGQTSYASADLGRKLVNLATDGPLGAFQSDGIPNWRYRLNQGKTFTISGNTLANPTVVTVTVAHGIATSATFPVIISGSNSTPLIDGYYTATATGATTFTIPVNVTTAGTAGTVVAPGIYDRDVAFYQRVVLGNLAHGIECTFWPDALEPNFEQVIMEVHGVLRLAIDVDGTIIGYCRNDQTGASGNYLYQDTVVRSAEAVIPGRRYTVCLFRRSGGGVLHLAINGVLEDLESVNASSADGWLVSGITIGMGAFRLNGRTDSAAGAYPTAGGVADPTTVSMDTRSGFMGRIEEARLLAGEYENTPLYKDENDTDYQVPQKLLWRLPNGSSVTTIIPESVGGEEYPANLAVGHGLVVAGKTIPITDNYYRDKELIAVYANTGLSSVTPIAPALAAAEDYGFDPDASASESGFGVLHGSVKTYFTVARWVFDQDDADTSYAGCYDIKLEGVIDGTSAAYNTLNATHVQLSQCEDRVKVLQHLQKRCTESDVMSLSWAATCTGSLNSAQASLHHSGRPYHFRSPKELAPTWGAGLLVPLTETNPITLIAEWQHQKSNETFQVIASSRSIYWAKPVWRNESPFVETAPHSLWAFGIPGDYAVINCSNSNQEFRKVGSNYTTVAQSLWVYGQRLDGNRLIMLKGNPATPRVNYAIGAIDGSLIVFGSAGTNARNWAYREGTFVSIQIHPGVTLRANAWNHVYVLIGSNTATGTTSARVNVWVNGHKVVMTADPNYDAITAASPDTGNFPLYLMGLKPSELRTALTGVVGSIDLTWRPWHGFVTEVRQTNAEEAAFYSVANFGFPPKERYDDSASTYLLIHANEGQDWSLLNSAAATAAADHGTVYFNELVTITNDADPLEESRDDRYKWVVFRDELLLTNGVSYPQRIRFTSFSDSVNAFRCYRLGMEAPFSPGVGAIGFAKTGTTSNPANAFNAVGAYDIYMSFVNELDEESEPTLVSRYVVTGASNAAPLAGFRLEHLPRSPDPQVKKRRIYISSVGGGIPLFHSDINDNESFDTQIYGLPSGDAVVVGDRLPAPKARHITAGAGTVFLIHLTDSAAGSNAFAWSFDSVVYFPLNRRALVDSLNGKALTGGIALRGALFLMKGDSTWRFSLSGAGNPIEAQANLLPINESVGLPGALTSFDNLLYGTGERGPYAFDGNNHVYLGKSLKDDYQALGLTQSSRRLDEAFLGMFGAFERPNSQYWISVRQPDRTYNEFAYVLHTAIGDKQSWTKLQLPKHTYMQESTTSQSASPGILLGTLSGQLLRYSTDVNLDGHGNTKQFNLLTVLSGTVTSGTTTSLTTTLPSGRTWETIGNGLRGCTVRVNGVDRVIERSSGSTLYWRTPLSSSATGTFYVGAYNSNWTTGWMALASYGHWTTTRFINLDYAPSATTLVVENHIANTLPTDRAFPVGAESRSISLATGYLTQPLPTVTKNHGRYVRLRFSANGHLDPWLVTGLGLSYSETGVRGQPT